MKESLIDIDARAHSRLFVWFGAPSAERLIAVSAALGPLPTDLFELWRRTGGGDIFESETLLGPSGIDEDDVLAENRRLHEHGMPSHLCLFHRGAMRCAIDRRSGGYVFLDAHDRVVREVATLNEWYASLRSEFGARYGIGGGRP